MSIDTIDLVKFSLIARCMRCPNYVRDECGIKDAYDGVPDDCPLRAEYEEWSESIRASEGGER